MSQAIERVLRAGGFVTAVFAEAALEADAAAADGLVLDIHLPGMSGSAVLFVLPETSGLCAKLVTGRTAF
jgi:DNA-binding response OmpR family regulator